MTTPPANLPPVDPVLNKVVEMLKFSGITYGLVAVQGSNIVLVKCGGYDEDSMYAAFRRYVRTNLNADSAELALERAQEALGSIASQVEDSDDDGHQASAPKPQAPKVFMGDLKFEKLAEAKADIDAMWAKLEAEKKQNAAK